jgi:hypothetical protein
LKRIISEPLVHFLVLGATLFGLYAALNPAAEPRPEEIVVSAGKMDHLAATFTKTWQRPPTATELKELVDQFVREEILSREAIKLGLDQDDTVIRRRLQLKMEFLAEDTSGGEPTDAELADYLAKHPDDFRMDERYDFRQIFLDPDKRGDRLEADAGVMLASLKQSGAEADTEELGDAVMLPREVTDESQPEVASQFGREFAATLASMKLGEWSGPIPSAYGSHLVFVARRSAGRLPELDEVREQVKTELANARRLAANRKFLDDLLAKYRVTIEWPRTATDPKKEADGEQEIAGANR